MGPLAGHGYRASLGYGLRTAVTVVFWGLLVFSIYEMILRSMKMRYDGPMEALLGAVDLALEHGRAMLNAPVLTTLFTGGILAGLVVEWAGRRWR
jgi:hypothetical protein